MPNLQFLEPSTNSVSVSDYKTIQIGEYGTVSQVIINGTSPEVLCSETTEIKFATLSVDNGNAYVLIDNNTSVSATPVNYNYKLTDGDNWVDFRLGKQRHSVCSDDGFTVNIKVAIANQEVVII